MTEVSIEDITRALEHANRRSEALLEVLRALQRAIPTDEEDASSETKETLTNLIIMRTRLNERQSVLPGLLREAAGEGLTSVGLPDDVAEQLGLG
ncbi:MAG: hypothetical protein OXD46_04820 [Chloroflexi bacterium]|nr:hypothetical protein [Chloroflexota bacterium]